MIRSILKLNRKLNQGNARYSYYATLSSIPPQVEEIDKATKKLESKVFHSKLFIRPFGCLLGVSRKELTREKGKPRYSIKGDWKELETLIYKQKLKSTESIVQLHFYENELFLVKSDFSSATIGVKELSQLVYNSVCKKYLNAEPESSFHSILLQDKRNAKLILLTEGFSPSIYYFLDTPETKELFKNLRPKKANQSSSLSRTSLSNLV